MAMLNNQRVIYLLATYRPIPSPSVLRNAEVSHKGASSILLEAPQLGVQVQLGFWCS